MFGSFQYVPVSLTLGSPNWTQQSGDELHSDEQGGIPSWTWWQCSQHGPGHSSPFWCSPGAPEPFLAPYWVSPRVSWACSSPNPNPRDRTLCSSLLSCPAWPGPSGQQHIPLAHQPLLPGLCPDTPGAPSAPSSTSLMEMQHNLGLSDRETKVSKPTQGPTDTAADPDKDTMACVGNEGKGKKLSMTVRLFVFQHICT